MERVALEPLPPCPTIFQTLLDPHEPMTISIRAQLSPSVVDTRFVAVTHRAAQLYGYDEPGPLEGQFTSPVHVLADIQRTRLRSAWRALQQISVTECYEVRIVRRTGEIVRVVKRVEQRQVGETLVWICHLAPAREHRPFQPPPLPDALPDEAVQTFFGHACVAEIEALLRVRARHAPRQVAPTLGQLLRQARHAYGLSLRQASAQICRDDGQPITHQYLQDLERDRRHPSLAIVRALARVFALDEERLVAAAYPAATALQAYLQHHPGREVGLSQFLWMAQTQGFVAWERFTRQLARLDILPLPPGPNSP